MSAGTCWLIDLENTGARWALASRLFQPGDLVAMFWSDKSCLPDIKAMSAPLDVKFMFLQCENGTPNAMDFQLAAWLGRASMAHPGMDLVILSGDKGYAPLQAFMQSQGASVSLMDPNEIPAQPDADTYPSRHDPIRAAYIDKLAAAGVTDREDVRILSAILIQSMRLPKNMRKLDTRNRLTNRYGAQDGNLKYNAIKDTVHDISENGPSPEPDRNPVTSDDVNKALGKAKVQLKTGTVAKALNAVKIAAACTGGQARFSSLEKSAARIFQLKDRKKAVEALMQFLPPDRS